MYKYVCVNKSFPNCRVHDGPSTEITLMFFKDMDEVKYNIAQTYNHNEYGNLYSIEDGQKVARIRYEFVRHELREVTIHHEEGGIFLSDGYGKYIWKTFDEHRKG